MSDMHSFLKGRFRRPMVLVIRMMVMNVVKVMVTMLMVMLRGPVCLLALTMTTTIVFG